MRLGWHGRGRYGTMADNIGTAYVQIEPSFDGVTPKIESHFSGEGEKASKSFGSGFGSVVGTVGKVMAGAAAAGATAIAGLTKEAVSSFADYEQLSGGIETLFGNTAEAAMDNASKAFETAGLSANQYMETVTGFAAALKTGLGDEYAWQMAAYADQAVVDMADNANKMGTSMESIQNAYQGFAKQNFTMLDNLKLGYGGTKEEMERLMRKAEEIEGYEIGSLDMNNFADVVEAIHIIQDNMGIAGTTADEAEKTISGSLGMMQASWQNLMTGIASGDMSTLSKNIDELVASAGKFGKNIMPVIKQALQGVSQLITELAPEIAAALPELISEVLPGLLTAGVDIIKALGEGIIQAIPDLMPTITEVILQLCDMLVQMLPELIQVGLQVILELAMGIAQALPELIPAIVETVMTIVEYLIDNIDLLIDASIAIIMALADGLIEALPKLIEKAPEIIMKLLEALIRNAPKILEAGVTLIFKLIEGIVSAWTKLFQVGKDVVDKFKEGFSDKVEEAKKWGKDLIQNFIDGILDKFEALKGTVKKCAQAVKDFLGFSEPKEGPLSDFHTFAPDMMDLFAEGITENIGTVEQALNDATADVMSSGLNVEAAQDVQMSVNPASMTSSDDRIGRIEALLEEFITNFKQDIYLDTGALVGGTVNAYNNALGQLALQGASR